jgi:hypothetical protein
MFTVSDSAAARLASRLTKEAQERTFRFVREDRGWRLQLGYVTAGDTIIQHQSKPVLVLDRAVADGLADRSLDLKGTGRAARLHLHRQDR